jgi:nitrate reductase NapE component
MKDAHLLRQDISVSPDVEPWSVTPLFGHPIWTVFAFLVAGCDPVISIAGATFPVWMLCLFAGLLAALAIRPLFFLSGVDDWLAPRPFVYSCLALIVAFLCWLTIWWRT